eukprot:gene7988-12453_t
MGGPTAMRNVGGAETPLYQIPNSNYSQIFTSICDANTNGFSAFSLSNSKLLNETTCDYFYHKTKRYFGKHTKNCSVESEDVTNFIRGNWDLTTVTVKIPSQSLNSSKYLLVRCDSTLNNFTHIKAIINLKEDFLPCNNLVCIPNLGNISGYYFTFELFMIISMIILSIIVRNWQPFKSRGIVLTFALLVDLVSIIFDSIPYIFSLEFSYLYETNILMTFIVPFKLSILLLIFINFLRMLLILYIQKNIDSIHENKLPLIVIRLIRFLKLSTSGLGASIIWIISSIIGGLFYVLLILFFGTINPSYGYNVIPLIIFQYFQVPYDIITIGISLVLILIDFFSNFKDFFQNSRKFWITNDPFRFRTQIFTLTFAVVIYFSRFFFILYQTSNIKNQTTLSCLSSEFRTLDIVLGTLSRIAIIFYFSGFILFYTLFQKLYNTLKFRGKRIDFQLDTIEEVFQNEEIFNIFYGFIKNEYSLENIFLYQDIKKYENLESINERKSFGMEIFMKYLNGQSSELEANVSGSVIKKVSDLISSNNFEVDLFDQVLICAKENLTDSYSRFIISEKFENYKIANSLIDENTGLMK